MTVRALARAVWIGAALTAYGLGPQEIVLLVNQNSGDSLRIANEYARMRKIPGANIIHLDLPESVRSTPSELAPTNFSSLIWKPVSDELAKRGLADHILAWVYSADFPTRILSDPPMSLHGITFTRGVIPPADDIRKGLYRSPLFGGPDSPDGPMGQTLSLEQFAARLRLDMPLPAMSLGVTGTRGLTVDEVITRLKYGLISDASSPNGRFYLVKSADVRTESRAWQFPIAEEELKKAGADVRIVDAPPAGDTQIMGIMMGLSEVNPSAYGTYMPGALGDHLTSFGGIFETDEQTKLTAWLRAGATASAGTVTEPYALWSKFPNARLFAHYFNGATVLEAYYASVRCPLQLLIVGDPLARPWGHVQPLALACLADDSDSVTGMVSFLATTFSDAAQPRPAYLFLLDSRALDHPSGEPELAINTASLADGYHELRAVAYGRGNIKHQSFATAGFVVRNHGVGIKIIGLKSKAEIDVSRPFDVKVEAEGQPSELAIISHERVLSKTDYSTNAVLVLDPRELGEGPVTIQAAARYGEPPMVRSAPITIIVKNMNHATEMKEPAK